MYLTSHHENSMEEDQRAVNMVVWLLNHGMPRIFEFCGAPGVADSMRHMSMLSAEDPQLSAAQTVVGPSATDRMRIAGAIREFGLLAKREIDRGRQDVDIGIVEQGRNVIKSKLLFETGVGLAFHCVNVWYHQRGKSAGAHLLVTAMAQFGRQLEELLDDVVHAFVVAENGSGVTRALFQKADAYRNQIVDEARPYRPDAFLDAVRQDARATGIIRSEHSVFLRWMTPAELHVAEGRV
jgi:hypothetical protein